MGQDGDGNGNWARRRRNDDNENHDDGKKTCTKNIKINAGFVTEEYLLAVEVLNALWQNIRTFSAGNPGVWICTACRVNDFIDEREGL